MNIKYSKFFITLLLLVFIASANCSEKSVLIPRKILFGNSEKTLARISPDGKKLAYLASDENNVLNVWVRDLSIPGSDEKVTSETKRGIQSFLWQYDQTHILYEQDKDGDENFHLYQTNIHTKKTKDLTPYANVKAGIVNYLPQFPSEMLIKMNVRDPANMDVYRLNLKTGHLELDTENPGGVFHWIADHKMQIRAAQSYAKEGALIRVRDSSKGAWRDLISIDMNEIGPLAEMGGVVVDFSANDKSLYVLSTLGKETVHLIEVDVDSGKYRSIVDDPQFDLSDLMFHPTTHQIEAIGLEKERYDWIVMNSDLQSDFEFLTKSLNTPFRIANRDLSNKIWVVASISDKRPYHYYLYDHSNKNLTFLFSTHPALEKYELCEMMPISFEARDGMQIFGYLTLPLNVEARNLPTVLYVHGGPWARDCWGLSPNVQWLANRGYAVLQINYRGSSGYGKKYINAGNKQWSLSMQTDLLDGKQWLVRQGISNPEKVAIFGGSYGGYATLVGLAFTPDEFCCGVDVVGPSNLVTLLKTIPPYWSPGKLKWDIRLGNLETEENFLMQCSPFFKADQIKKPLLIAQGANDPRVKQSESDQIVQAMRKNKLTVEYLLFPDEGHGFKRPENRMKFSAAVEEFFAKYLGGLQEKPSLEENWFSLKK